MNDDLRFDVRRRRRAAAPVRAAAPARAPIPTSCSTRMRPQLAARPDAPAGIVRAARSPASRWSWSLRRSRSAAAAAAAVRCARRPRRRAGRARCRPRRTTVHRRRVGTTPDTVPTTTAPTTTAVDRHRARRRAPTTARRPARRTEAPTGARVPAPTTHVHVRRAARSSSTSPTAQVSLASSAPPPGYTAEVHDNGPTRVEVRFNNGQTEWRIRVDVVNGSSSPEITQHWRPNLDGDLRRVPPDRSPRRNPMEPRDAAHRPDADPPARPSPVALRRVLAVAAGVAMVPALYAVASAATGGGGSPSTRVRPPAGRPTTAAPRREVEHGVVVEKPHGGATTPSVPESTTPTTPDVTTPTTPRRRPRPRPSRRSSTRCPSPATTTA